jgi:hypothetical protein
MSPDEPMGAFEPRGRGWFRVELSIRGGVDSRHVLSARACCDAWSPFGGTFFGALLKAGRAGNDAIHCGQRLRDGEKPVRRHGDRRRRGRELLRDAQGRARRPRGLRHSRPRQCERVRLSSVSFAGRVWEGPDSPALATFGVHVGAGDGLRIGWGKLVVLRADIGFAEGAVRMYADFRHVF